MPPSLPELVTKAKPFVLQAAVLGGLGLGTRALRYLVKPKVHALVATRPPIVAHGPLAETLSPIVSLCDESRAGRLLDKVERVLELDRDGNNAAAQWHISRLSGDILRDAQAICKVSALADNEVFRLAMTCQEENIPQLQGHLDDLLWNHLLGK